MEEFEIVEEDYNEFPTFLPKVIDQVRVNFVKFWSLPLEAVDMNLIVERCPSLGIAGWSDSALVVLDHGSNDSERRMREHQERALGGPGSGDDEDVENQKVQIIKLIPALGQKDSGRDEAGHILRPGY